MSKHKTRPSGAAPRRQLPRSGGSFTRLADGTLLGTAQAEPEAAEEAATTDADASGPIDKEA